MLNVVEYKYKMPLFQYLFYSIRSSTLVCVYICMHVCMPVCMYSTNTYIVFIVTSKYINLILYCI